MSFFGYCSKNYKDERGREYYFDNAKFILILLVVFGHAISPFKSEVRPVKMVWTFIYSFHMPCMILISGFFSKSYIKNGVVKTQRLLTYIVYYVTAQVAVSLFEYFVLGYKNVSVSILDPKSTLWYLVCLIWWFMVLPYVNVLQPKYLLIFSFLFGLAIGYDVKAGNLMSITKAINYFPFFLIGYYFKPEWIHKFRNKFTQIISIIIICLVGILIYCYIDIIPSRIFTCNFNYYKSNFKVLNSDHTMFLNRLIFYFVALLMCASFMLLIPRGKAFFTRFGSRTLQVYILHKFLYLAEEHYKWYELFMSRKGIFVLCLIVIIVTFILSLKPFEYPFKWLAKIKLKRFKKV